jgi:hypothetical protein
LYKNNDVENLFGNESSPNQVLSVQTKIKKTGGGEEEESEEKEEEYKSVPHSETEDLSRTCFRSVAQISTSSINIALIFQGHYLKNPVFYETKCRGGKFEVPATLFSRILLFWAQKT